MQRKTGSIEDLIYCQNGTPRGRWHVMAPARNIGYPATSTTDAHAITGMADPATSGVAELAIADPAAKPAIDECMILKDNSIKRTTNSQSHSHTKSMPGIDKRAKTK